jgi:beta-1,4-N-acetylglucosaminyltransferase
LTPAALKSIHKRGISRLLLQVGRGREENARAASQRDPSCKENGGVKIEYYRFKDSLLEDLKNAELVISHAGTPMLRSPLVSNCPLS